MLAHGTTTMLPKFIQKIYKSDGQEPNYSKTNVPSNMTYEDS